MKNNLLLDARQIADYAKGLGIEISRTRKAQPTYIHIGATLADSILQAGVNYETVVFPRVSRIIKKYPSTDTLKSVKHIVLQNRVDEYLAWRHPTKQTRFSNLVDLLDANKVSDMKSLKQWLLKDNNLKKLISINGIGQKTCDYLCRLAGIDSIAVDRHITHFVGQAGIKTNDYNHVKTIVSFAADLLGISRWDFDSWIWSSMANYRKHEQQLRLPLN